MKHLAKFNNNEAEKILAGKKNIESRFSKTKIGPFGAISSGDLVYIKTSGRDIIGQFRVKKVIFFEGFNREDLIEIKARYKDELNVEENYWKDKEYARYLTLIFIGNSSRFITSPIKAPKKDLRDWVTLN